MKRLLIWAGLLVIAAVVIAYATAWLSVLDRPGGSEVGTWNANAEVLVVDGDWAMVRMTGWVRQEQVAPAAPDGQRLLFSPGGGLWVRNITMRVDDSGGVWIMGRIVNATGRDFYVLSMDIVTLDSAGSITSFTTAVISELPSGKERVFLWPLAPIFGTDMKPQDVHDWQFQFNFGT